MYSPLTKVQLPTRTAPYHNMARLLQNLQSMGTNPLPIIRSSPTRQTRSASLPSLLSHGLVVCNRLLEHEDRPAHGEFGMCAPVIRINMLMQSGKKSRQAMRPFQTTSMSTHRFASLRSTRCPRAKCTVLPRLLSGSPVDCGLFRHSV